MEAVLVDVRLLGPVELWVKDTAVPAGEPRRLAVLAALAVDAGHVVPMDTLVHRVWGDSPPAQAVSTLRAYITRIRRTLEQATGDDEPITVSSQAGGYRLRLARERVDLFRFRDLVERARDADSAAERVELLRAARQLWRSEPLAGVTGDWAVRTREQLTGEWLAATVAWTDAELAIGNVEAVHAPLATLAAEHPLTESLVEAQVHALVAAGRPTQALERCRAHRQLLAEEYGTDQGPQLRALYETILRSQTESRDVEVTPDSGALLPPAATSTVPAHSPEPREPVDQSRQPRMRWGSAPLAAVAIGLIVVLAVVLAVNWSPESADTRVPPAAASPTSVAVAASGTRTEQFSTDLDQEQWRKNDQARDNGSSWSPEMVRVADGELQVRGVGRNPSGQGNMSGSVCWCAHRATAPIRQYGVWEARAKFDAGGGYGAILGLWANDDSGQYLTLARLNTAARTSMYPEMQDQAGNTVVGPSIEGDFTDWHTFGIEWRKEFFTFSVDRHVIFDSRQSSTPLHNPDQPMYLYVSMDSGPQGPIPGPNQDTPSTVTIHVDWVRYQP